MHFYIQAKNKKISTDQPLENGKNPIIGLSGPKLTQIGFKKIPKTKLKLRIYKIYSFLTPSKK